MNNVKFEIALTINGKRYEHRTEETFSDLDILDMHRSPQRIFEQCIGVVERYLNERRFSQVRSSHISAQDIRDDFKVRLAQFE